MIDLRFERGDIGDGVGSFGDEDAVHEVNDGLLLGKGDAGDREVLPVVGVEMDVAAAVRTQEVAGDRGVHHA